MQTSPSYIHNVLLEAAASPTQVPTGTFIKFQQFSSRWGKTNAKVSQGPSAVPKVLATAAEKAGAVSIPHNFCTAGKDPVRIWTEKMFVSLAGRIPPHYHRLSFYY